MSRQRLDNELVRRGLVENRSQAQEVIKAGRVTVDGAPADKPSRMVALSQTLFVAGDPPRYVSRGGLKLEAALEFFNIDVNSLIFCYKNYTLFLKYNYDRYIFQNFYLYYLGYYWLF